MLALVAACGGSGGGALAPTDPAPSANTAPVLNVSGVAAVGAALAAAKVSVKCASGTGETSSDANGRFALSLTNGSLPCAIQVLGEAGGVSVTLHSVAVEGAVTGSDVSAVANVTPVTEMIVAHLSGALPMQVFESFSARSTITGPELASATSAVAKALKAGTGIDLAAIDPFKSALVPASSENTAGNTHDQLLDRLGEKVSTRTLGAVVTQIAYAASTGTTAATRDATTLADVMAAVDAGAMPHCPHVVSGKYRVLEYTGRTHVARLDFKNLRYDRADGTALGTIAALNAAEPCEFTVSGTIYGGDHTAKFSMGANGGGMFRAVNNTTSGSTVGHIFPVQVHSQDAAKGPWTLLLSGQQEGRWKHVLSRLTVGKDGEATVCDYDGISKPSCVNDINLVIAERSDGGFSAINTDAAIEAQAWMYIAPNGRETLFGSTNPIGDASAPDQRHFAGSRPMKQSLPALDSVVRYAEATLSVGASYGTSTSTNAITYTAVDAATSTVTRVRQSNGRIDRVRYDFPIDGVRFRAGGNSPTAAGGIETFSDMLQLPLGTGTIAFNAAPQSVSQPHFFSVLVNRP